MLEVRNVNLFYNKYQVLFDLNFKLEQGEILGFLGPNGAGKSSTMRILTGYLTPSSGSVRFLGKEVSKSPLFLRENLGYLPETNPLYLELRVREYLKWVAELKQAAEPQKEVDRVMERCGLKEVEKKLIRHLSKGYRQRVGLAQALIGNPKLIILDEPTVGLDPTQVREIRELIRELGKEKTILLSTHILSEVELICKRVIIINQGRILTEASLEDLIKEGTERYFLSLESSSYKSELRADLEKVVRITAEDRTEKEVHLEFKAQNKEDIRFVVADLVASYGGKVLEFRPKRSSLEEIFVNLVYKGEQK
ncbi:MAG: gliding motility-associated transport system ATP-binding protein [Desulfonauticus sp.]|jgi:ABC-2 type transport system ATP-binding protein|nr:MAG: ATP-binding protein of ABC transporter [Desulfonauticus sp. 38_4375]MDK2921137.1 gliding motility-associated transport system ATP-binding protein [Desulfonauticus sp.]